MRKRIITALFIFFFIFFTAGCSGSSYTITTGDLNSSVNSISGKYHSFNGYYYKSAKFTQGDFIEFDLTLKTEAGKFSALLLDPDGKVIAEINKDKTARIDTTGTYKVQINGSHHKGSFILQWNKKEY